MEFTLKGYIEGKMPSFIRGKVKVKVKHLGDLEKSIDYNKGYLILDIKHGDNGNYLTINDYYKGKKK